MIIVLRGVMVLIGQCWMKLAPMSFVQGGQDIIDSCISLHGTGGQIAVGE